MKKWKGSGWVDGMTLLKVLLVTLRSVIVQRVTQHARQTRFEGKYTLDLSIKAKAALERGK